ncbi:response regulator [Flavobacterium sp.]|uniref:response regulator n=1 Tax=Flavobacterium sp. TaxID=239 RepID=UPI0025BC3696|nr:response regulator [Flavobacterium sp.]
MHILIAEDDEDDREVMQTCFEKHNGFKKVDLVSNGQELLDFLRDGLNAFPDIILTDINMPIMDGITALQEIFKDSELRKIPRFVYSTSTNPTYQAICIELEICAFIIKPFSFAGFDRIPDQIIATLPE